MNRLRYFLYFRGIVLTTDRMLTLDKIYQASYALKTVIRRTDLISAPNINPESHIFLKPENLQVTGSFKVRGACFKIAQLTEEEKSHGVVACSAGNHAQGVALAATAHGIKSLICLPDNAPISKVEATKSYGADVCLVEGVYDDAYNKALQLKDEKGYTFIHPFDDEDVIAGQGTIGLELLEQAKGAPSMLNSIEHGKIERLKGVRTIADGIAVKEPGIHTFDLCQQYVDEIVSVTDDEISTAILALIEQHKLIAEGAGAVAVAAAMFNKVPIKGKKVICLISGGNIDVNILSRVIGRGLQKSGRSCSMTIELVDKPGQLQHVSEIIASTGANVVSVYHERVSHTADINGCYLRLEMETRNQQQINEIRQLLTVSGYKIVEG